MGRGDGAGFLGIVNEVALGEVVGLFADDLDGVFVRADGAVGAETDEDATADIGGFEVEGLVVAEGRAGDIVENAEGEFGERFPAGEVIEGGLDHAGGEFFGAETVATADDTRRVGEGGEALGEGCDDVEIERFAEGAGFLAAVEDGDGFDGGREGGEEGFDVEREEETDGEDADLFALGDEPVHGFGDGLDGAAHGDDDTVGLGMSVVFVKSILASGDLGEAVHLGLNDGRKLVVEAVDGFAALEIDVGILGGALDGGPVGGEGAGAEVGDGFFANDAADFVVGEQGDFGDLVGSAEAVEEMDERDARAVASGGGDEGEIVGFLAVVGAEEGAAGGAAGHDIGVVAEDGEALRGDGAGGDVEGEREEFAGDLVEVGDHQQEPLRARERGGERASEETAVDGAGDAALGLELGDLGDHAPDVFFAAGGPFVAGLGHGRRRGDRVDRDELVDAVGYGGDGLVGVESYEAGFGGNVAGDGRFHGDWAANRRGWPVGATPMMPKNAHHDCARVGGGCADIVGEGSEAWSLLC